MGVQALYPTFVRQAEYSGAIYQFRLRGMVYKDGEPSGAKLYLYNNAGVVLRTITVRPNGEWEIKQLTNIPNGYFVIARDVSDEPVNSAIADYLTPEPIPDA